MPQPGVGVFRGTARRQESYDARSVACFDVIKEPVHVVLNNSGVPWQLFLWVQRRHVRWPLLFQSYCIRCESCMLSGPGPVHGIPPTLCGTPPVALRLGVSPQPCPCRRRLAMSHLPSPTHYGTPALPRAESTNLRRTMLNWEGCMAMVMVAAMMMMLTAMMMLSMMSIMIRLSTRAV